MVGSCYNEFEVVLALDGTILEDSLPIRQMKTVEAWAAIHEDELHAIGNCCVKAKLHLKLIP